MRSFLGVTRAVVTNIADPNNGGRIRFRAPSVLGALESEWAEPAVRPVLAATTGDVVYVMFENGDLARPVWLNASP